MRNIKIFLASLLIILGVSFTSCNNENIINVGPDKQDEPVIDRTAFAKGADVSWLTKMESEGHSFYNRNRVEKECIKLLKEDCNVNSIRLRVWEIGRASCREGVGQYVVV